MASTGNLILGISIIVVGVLLGLEAAGKLGADVRKFWPALLILIGLVSWATQGKKPSFANVIVITLGIILLLGNLNGLNGFGFLWPALFILTGLNLALGPKFRDKFLR
ncbi:MAG: hypothetical protein HOF01_10410 [Chloroflexi bacterium]|nr:hypothetical protein [Chloroflexota bacterium]